MSSLTTIEKEAGIILKKSRKGELRKYKVIGNNHRKICMKPDCLTYSMPKEKYCIRFINSGWCDINKKIEIKLTEKEKEAGITLRKNRKGEIKKYKKSGSKWYKVCEKEQLYNGYVTQLGLVCNVLSVGWYFYMFVS